MAEPSLPFPWPAAALAVLVGAACASSGNRAPVDGAPVPSASAASVAPTDSATRATTPVAEAADTPPPRPDPGRRDPRCDPGGPAPMLCVAASETEGEPATTLSTGGAGTCRSTPKVGICPGCRPHFVKLEKGQCCYRGLSRLPRCKDLPSDPR